MGIQPIDLQTLYTQLDKVGKLQGDVRQTFAAEFEKSQQANKEDAARRQQTVQKTESAGAEKTAVNKDGGGGAFGSFNNSPHQHKEDTVFDEKKSYYIQDPSLGKKIDISG
ncbi:MAG: hypothetical protein P1P65_01265 [Treponema sp.]